MKRTLTALLGLSLSYFGCSSADETFKEDPVDAGIDTGVVIDAGADANLDPKEELIYCLINANMEMFSKKYCIGCQKNIELFEPYFHLMKDYGKYHDCGEEKDLCDQLDVNGFPVWLWDRNDLEARHSGLIRLHCFEQFVGCVYDGPSEGDCPDTK